MFLNVPDSKLDGPDEYSDRFKLSLNDALLRFDSEHPESRKHPESSAKVTRDSSNVAIVCK